MIEDNNANNKIKSVEINNDIKNRIILTKPLKFYRK